MRHLVLICEARYARNGDVGKRRKIPAGWHAYTTRPDASRRRGAIADFAPCCKHSPPVSRTGGDSETARTAPLSPMGVPPARVAASAAPRWSLLLPAARSPRRTPAGDPASYAGPISPGTAVAPTSRPFSPPMRSAGARRERRVRRRRSTGSIAQFKAAGLRSPAARAGSWTQDVPLVRTQPRPGPRSPSRVHGRWCRGRDIYVSTVRPGRPGRRSPPRRSCSSATASPPPNAGGTISRASGPRPARSRSSSSTIPISRRRRVIRWRSAGSAATAG